MIEQCEKYLDCKQHLRSKIEMIKEAFIEYYGEDKRQEIEEKFSKGLFIAYRNPDSTDNILDKIREIHTKEIFEKVQERIPSQWTQEDLFDKTTFRYHNILPITKFKEFYDLYTIGEEGREQRFKEEGFKYIQKLIPSFTREDYEELIKTHTLPQEAEKLPTWTKNNILYYADLTKPITQYKRTFENTKKLLEKVDPNVSLETIASFMEKEEVQALIKYANSLPEMIHEYEERMRKYDSYQREIEESKAIEDQLSHQYFQKFMEENIDLLSEEEIEKVEDYKKDKNKFYYLPSFVTYVFGTSIKSTGRLESFSEESSQVLENPKEADWKKDSIKKDRIEYFKLKGLDLGDDYDAYTQSEEAKRIWPSEDRIKEFIESKKRLLNEFNNEYYTSLPAHKESRQEIDSHHPLEKDDSFDASLYVGFSSKTFVSPNVVETKDGYDLFSLVVINCNNMDGSVDHNIIHECNHLFELSLSEVNQDSYEAICGWDICTGEINKEKKSLVDTLKQDRDKRSYELMNEIINELIAQEIYSRMLERDEHIFDTSENAKVKYITSYENTFFLIKDFFQEFRKEILESRCNGQIEIIWNKVGKENFDALNDLFRIFNEHFQGFRYYGLIDSLKKKEDNEQTRVYYDLMAKRDEILDKMRKHSMLQDDNKEAEDVSEKSLS